MIWRRLFAPVTSKVRGSCSMARVTIFAATDASGGTELWRTDGTEAGTFRILDILAGASGSNPSEFVALGDGRALFRAADAAAGNELWVTDGTAAGTFRLT